MAIESVIIGDPDEVTADAPAKPVPVMDEGGELVKADVLPADFPVTATPVNDGTGAYRLALAYPVTLKFKLASGEIIIETYAELVLSRMTGKTFRAVREAAAENFRHTVLSVLSGLSLGRAKLLEDAMDVSDMSAVLSVYRFFTTPGRRTGP